MACFFDKIHELVELSKGQLLRSDVAPLIGEFKFFGCPR